MRLDDILYLVETSHAAAWHRIEAQTVYAWVYNCPHNLEPRTHELLFVHRENIDVSLAMAAVVKDQFHEPWVLHFADPNADSACVQLRHAGAIVFEWICVVVDGGRYLLPMPDSSGSGKFSLRKTVLPVARLFFNLFTPEAPRQLRTIEDALQQAGIVID